MNQPVPVPQTVTFDPVCGMELTLDRIRHATEWQGRPFYFCSSSCRDHFVGNPELYTAQVEKEEA